MIPLPWLGGGLALSLIAGFFGGWTVCTWRNEAAQLHAQQRADKREDDARKQGLEAGKAYADFSAANQQSGAADTRTIRETFREIHVPADCAAPAAVVGLLQDSVRGANAAAAGQPGTAVPGPAEPSGAADRP